MAGTYIVRVHIDVDGDGAVSQGDYITTGYYPVTSRGNPTDITVAVQRVT